MDAEGFSNALLSHDSDGPVMGLSVFGFESGVSFRVIDSRNIACRLRELESRPVAVWRDPSPRLTFRPPARSRQSARNKMIAAAWPTSMSSRFGKGATGP